MHRGSVFSKVTKDASCPFEPRQLRLPPGVKDWQRDAGGVQVPEEENDLGPQRGKSISHLIGWSAEPARLLPLNAPHMLPSAGLQGH